MAFEGYLIKVGTYEIPPEYIEANTFHSVIHGLDLDPFVDGNGETHRNVLDFVKPVITWDVPAPITEKSVRVLMNGIQANYISDKERNAMVSAFYPEIGETKTIKMYMSDPEYTIDSIDLEKNEITYSSFSLKFTAYGGKFE